MLVITYHLSSALPKYPCFHAVATKFSTESFRNLSELLATESYVLIQSIRAVSTGIFWAYTLG